MRAYHGSSMAKFRLMISRTTTDGGIFMESLHDLMLKDDEWRPRTSIEEKPGYTTPCGLWDGEDKDGNPIGGIMYMNDEDAVRWEKEMKRREKKEKRDILSGGTYF
jgi:hypothetical protein